MRGLTALRLAWRALVRRDERARYTLAERTAALLYPPYKFSEFGRTWLEDREFLALYARLCGERNWHSLDRKWTLDQLAGLARDVPGDTAECGVFRGASSYFICRRTAGTGKEHHLFDAFEGLPAPREVDGAYWKEGHLAADPQTALRVLAEFPFVRVHTGWIPTRFADVEERRFSLVHVDVDLYEPTRDSLQFFWPRLSRGGILICDDHGFSTCPGARRAWDEFFAGTATLALPTGQAVAFKGP